MVNQITHLPRHPTTKSWSHYSQVPDTCINEPCCLGVDEAGRGPVLGSMIYAVAYAPISRMAELKKLGFADSKVLKAEKRDGLFDVIREKGEYLGWAVFANSPQDISEAMFRRSKYNLNAIAHDTTIEIIQQVLLKGVNLTEIFVDTVGDPAKYRLKLEEKFPGIAIVVEKKADATYPIVSAASICAKVTRDTSMVRWQFIEPNYKSEGAFGSGYPADPNTVKWLKENLDPVFGYPRLVRFSWSTTDNLLEANAVKFLWAKDSDTIEKAWAKPITKVMKRDIIFSSIGLRHVKEF